MFKKLLFSSLTFLILFFSLVSNAMAQSTSPWYNQSFPQWSAKVFGGDQNEIFGERYTFAQVNWIINSLTAIIVGTDITQCIQVGSTGDLSKIGTCAAKLAPVDPTKLPGYTGSGGTITSLAYLTGSLITFRPASGISYTKDVAANLHVFPQAYAQTGAGYTAISPVQSLWQVVRDVSYALMVVVIIALAFMIMFRTKISPQVVVTIQSALPRIAIALILITFSYAIAGFLIDLMYVILGAFAATIKISNTTISHSSVSYLFGQLNSINGIVSLTIGLVIFFAILAAAGFLLTAAGIVGTVSVPIIGPIGLVGGIMILVGAIFIIWILFRLFWLMLKTATITVLLIIAAPLMILIGTLSPNGGFWGWFRTVLSNLAVYPTVAIMVFLSHYFFWAWAMGAITGQNLIPFNPLNTYGINALQCTNNNCVVNFPGMQLSTSIIGFFAALVIIFLIPKASEVIQAMITGKGLNIGAAINEGIGPARELAMGSLGYASGQQQQRYQEMQRLVQNNPNLSIPQSEERARDVWNFIRGASRGQIK